MMNDWLYTETVCVEGSVRALGGVKCPPVGRVGRCPAVPTGQEPQKQGPAS